MASQGPGNASLPAAAGPLPSPAALPLAELLPALNDTALAQEIATDLGLVSNASTTTQASNHGGTPGWTTGLLAALISVAVIVSMATVFVLIHRNLRRQRREVLESFLAFQEAETAALEAANTAHQRLMLARASRAAALSPRQPREPPVVVVQPDMSPSLCVKDRPSSSASGDNGSSGRDGSGGRGLPAGSSSGCSSTAGGRQQGQAGGVPGPAAASTGAAGATAAAAMLAGQPGEADLEAGPADAAGSSSSSGGGTAAAAASPAAAAAAAPSSVQRLTLAFPGLGATVLLLLPSGPQSAGLLLWDDGSRASVLPGASWRGWGAHPPHEPPPVFQSDIELAARSGGEQREGEQGEQQNVEQQQQGEQQGEQQEGQPNQQQQGEPAQQAAGAEDEGQEGQKCGRDRM